MNEDKGDSKLLIIPQCQYIVHPESSRTQRAFAFQTLLRLNAY